MKKSAHAAIAAALLVGLSAPSFGQTAPQKQARAQDPNEVICEKQEVVGSRLAVRRVCKTRAEWAEQRLQDRQDLEKTQVQRGIAE